MNLLRLITFRQHSVQQPAVNVSYLVVAGGGSGGYNWGAGGGAGEMIEGQIIPVLSSVMSLSVGAGGASVSADAAGNDGGNSVFGSIVALGGGGGGANQRNGRNGGSGGGASFSGSTFGTGSVGGNSGGTATGTTNSTGGGGGAGTPGGNAAQNLAGNGGSGKESIITGTGVYYAGGGAGLLWPSSPRQGVGGIGGGGAVSVGGTANTGGGGGASYFPEPSGSGGSGVVILKVPTLYTTEFSAGVSYSLSTSTPGYNIYVITATATVSETVMFTYSQQEPTSFDPDAQAFITATGITDSTQQSAVDVLVKDLKNYNLWSKMKAIYPMVGGTATTHKYNLKDPRDLDVAFRLEFINSWTHASTGAKPINGSGYATTYLSPRTHSSQDSFHASYYVRNHVAGGFTEMGPGDLTGGCAIAYNWNGNSYPACTTRQSSIGGASTTPSYWIISRISSTNYGWFRNTIKTTINKNSELPMTNNILLGGYGFDYNGGGRECAFVTIGDGLSDSEVGDLYTVVQAFQTALNRQV
jgi:hypothetical protein